MKPGFAVIPVALEELIMRTSNQTYGSSIVVLVQEDSEFMECVFDNCEIVGSLKGANFERCLFYGRAAAWFQDHMNLCGDSIGFGN